MSIEYSDLGYSGRVTYSDLDPHEPQTSVTQTSANSFPGKFVAWTCRRGVVVYDVEQERVISIVKYDKPILQTPTKETGNDSPESFSRSGH